MTDENHEIVSQLRDTIHKVSEEFPGEYWREKDPAFVAKVTEGFKKIYKD